MAAFDAYLAVDWSASSVPKLGKDSVWLCLGGGEPENHATRAAATERVRELLRAHAAAGRRTLVGFDFPYGYPAGFADAVAPEAGPAWRRTWALLAELVADDEANRNNRFDVAAELNRRLGAAPGPFWGCTARAARPELTQRRPFRFPFRGLADLRATDRAAGSGIQSPWKLGGPGSVGSQALLGIPWLASLRDDPELAAVSAVWPFEPHEPALVVHAEIWPRLAPRDSSQPVADAAQVESVVRRWAAEDERGRLAAALGQPLPAAARAEEGWILGAGGGVAVAAVAPHGELEGGLAAAMETLAARLAAAEPDAVVLATPHNVHVEGHFAVVVAARIGEHEVDGELAAAILGELRAAGIPALAVSFGGNDAAESEMPLDWGTEVPLRFLPRLPLVVVSPARDRPFEEHVRAGEAIAAACAARRVAFVASADHGHAHLADGPYGFHEAAARYDELVQALVHGHRLDRWPELAALVEPARADSLWQLLLLHGALRGGGRVELLAYERPSYYGMLVAVYER